MCFSMIVPLARTLVINNHQHHLCNSSTVCHIVEHLQLVAQVRLLCLQVQCSSAVCLVMINISNFVICRAANEGDAATGTSATTRANSWSSTIERCLKRKVTQVNRVFSQRRAPTTATTKTASCAERRKREVYTKQVQTSLSCSIEQKEQPYSAVRFFILNPCLPDQELVLDNQT